MVGGNGIVVNHRTVAAAVGRTGEAESLAEGHTYGTVGKALQVLESVALLGRPARFGEVQAQLPFPTATTHRLLHTLCMQGMVARDPGPGTYRIGIRLVRLAHQAWAQSSIAPVARPHVDRLSTRLGETVHLAQLESGQVLYVDKRSGRSPIDMFSGAGKVGPAYCTGIGKAMLAFLPPAELERALGEQSFRPHTPATLTSAGALRRELEDIRDSGISYDREEHEPRIICVAVPIRSGTGAPLGGISVTSSTLRHTLEELSDYAPDLAETADRIAAELRPWTFPSAADREQEEGTA